MHDPLFPRHANRSPLGLLPYDILEDITEHLSRRDLCYLMLASQECSNLAARALYSNIPLSNLCNHVHDSLPYHTLRRRQFSFFVAISQHPDYTRFIRRIAFEFTDQEGEASDYNYPIPSELVWRTFAKCQGVVYVDIRANRRSHIDDPKVGLFPNLRRARVSGPLSAQTLAQLLNTSPSIHALEFSSDSSTHTTVSLTDRASLTRIARHLDRFECLRGDYPALRTLNIEIQDGVSLTSLTSFLKHVRMHVTLLILAFPPEPEFELEPFVADADDDDSGENRNWSNWIQNTLVGFTKLEELWLKGLKVDDDLSKELKKIDTLKTVRHVAVGKECLSVRMD